MVNIIEQELNVLDNYNIKKLDNKLEQLKFIFECPRLFICNYFNDLRSKIDLAFVKKMFYLNDKSIKQKLNENWTKMIDLIDSIEMRLMLLSKTTNKFNSVFSQEISKKIEFIEKLIKQTAVINKTNEFKDIDYLISEQIFKIEKFLLQNQTLVFINETNCKINNLFNKMNSQYSPGKLIFIKNEYFSVESIQYLLEYKNLKFFLFFYLKF
jgi:hypothetical protein